MKILDSWRRHRIASDNPKLRWRRRPSRAEHVMVVAVFLASVLLGATVTRPEDISEWLSVVDLRPDEQQAVKSLFASAMRKVPF